MKKTIYRVLLTAAFALIAAGASAQMKTSYFMEGSIPRYDMNAAMTPGQGYVNFPLVPLGAFGFNMNNNFLAIDNFIYNRDGRHVTFLHPSVGPKEFMRRMPHRASLNMDMNYNLLGFGKYSRKHNYFWSFGWNLRAVMDVGIPKEMFGILKDLQNGSFDIPDITAGGTAYSEFAFGFAMPIAWQNLTVGGRLKVLTGVAQAEASLNSINLDVNASSVTARAKGEFKGSVFGKSYAGLPNGRIRLEDIFSFEGMGISDIMSNGFRSWGAAIDLGAEAKLLDDRLKVSVALNDLGFISWSGANSINGSVSDLWFEFTGYDIEKGEAKIEYSEDVDLNKTGGNGYAKRLSTSMNVGAEYTFLDNLLGVGLLSHTKFANRIAYSELTLIGTVRPARWFTASISQSLVHNRIGILGFALNFHPRGFNFFTGVDYIPSRMASFDISGSRIMFPAHAKSLNLYFGIAFGIGRQKPW